MIEPSKILPLRLINPDDINSSPDGDFAINQVQSFQLGYCYTQKFQLSDSLVLQIPSFDVPGDLNLKQADTGITVASIPWELKDITIIGHDFKIYEINQPLAGYPEGTYYVEFTYTNDVNEVITQQSETISIAEVHEQTVLIKYKHSTNDFDIVFNTGIEFQFRVEGAVQTYSPGNNRNTFEDQTANLTQLSSTPFDKRKFYLGYGSGVPEWVLRKINFIQSVNQKTYDNVPYEIEEGAEYELTYNNHNAYVGGSIDIRYVQHRFNRYQSEQTVIDPANIFTPMQKLERRINVGANFNIPNVFNDFSLIEKIMVTKRSVANIELVVGTSNGGNQVGEFTIDDAKFTQVVDFYCGGNTTLYFSGLAGADCDIFVIYKQLDAPDIDLGNIGGGGVPEPDATVPERAGVIYMGTQAELEIDFDTDTGLGRDNTIYFGYAICDGRNGTPDMRGRAVVGLNNGDPDFGTMYTPTGSKQETLVKGQIPLLDAKGMKDGDWVNGKRPALGNGDTIYWPKSIANIGSETPTAISHIQPSIPVVFIKRIF